MFIRNRLENTLNEYINRGKLKEYNSALKKILELSEDFIDQWSKKVKKEILNRKDTLEKEVYMIGNDLKKKVNEYKDNFDNVLIENNRISEEKMLSLKLKLDCWASSLLVCW